MPHILILDEWATSLAQLHDHSELIHTNIENEQYKGEQKAMAEQHLEDVETLMTTINTNHRVALDNQINALEEFLGI